MRKIVRISALLLMTLSAQGSEKVTETDDSYLSKHFIDDDRCLWEMSGDFRQYKDFGAEADLCRQCVIKPVSQLKPNTVKQALELESNACDPVRIRKPAIEIRILGYKDNTVRIWLDVSDEFKNPSRIAEDLNFFKVGQQYSYLKKVFITDGPENFKYFLDLFMCYELLTPKVSDRVLKIAQTPKHTFYGVPPFQGERRMGDLDSSIHETFSGEIPGLANLASS